MRMRLGILLAGLLIVHGFPGLLTYDTVTLAQGDTQPPFVSSRSPAPNSTGLSPTISVTATFNEPVQRGSISFVLTDSAGDIVVSAVTCDSLTRTATLDPSTDLPGSRIYIATASGVLDLAGNLMSSPFVWSFTTATPGFQESVVFSGLVQPTVVEFAADGRVFVGEKSGLIKVFDDLSDTTPTIFADLRTNVSNFWDRGLLGMALHPDFPTIPYVYVLYTYDAAIGGTAPRWGSPGVSSDPCPAPPGATVNGCVVSGRLSRAYHHSERVISGDACGSGGSSITGGAFYGTGNYPAAYEDALFFADYSRNCIWVMFKEVMGKAVVASKTGPGPELIEDDSSGMLCDPQDPDSIATKVIGLLKDTSLRQQVGARAAARCQQVFGRHAGRAKRRFLPPLWDKRRMGMKE